MVPSGAGRHPATSTPSPSKRSASISIVVGASRNTIMIPLPVDNAAASGATTRLCPGYISEPSVTTGTERTVPDGSESVWSMPSEANISTSVGSVIAATSGGRSRRWGRTDGAVVGVERTLVVEFRSIVSGGAAVVVESSVATGSSSPPTSRTAATSANPASSTPTTTLRERPDVADGCSTFGCDVAIGPRSGAPKGSDESTVGGPVCDREGTATMSDGGSGTGMSLPAHAPSASSDPVTVGHLITQHDPNVSTSESCRPAPPRLPRSRPHRCRAVGDLCAS